MPFGRPALMVFAGLTVGAATVHAAQTNAPAAPATAIDVTEIAHGLEHPWSLQFLPDGRYLVTERPGRIRVVGKDGKLSEPVSGVPEVVQEGQAGLLDILLAPDFATSGLIYFSFSEPRDGGTNGTAVARGKLTLSDAGGALSDLAVIFRQQPSIASSAHFGSRLVWAKDGTLFITLGERYSQRNSAQDLSTDLGKIVRIDADGSIPKDNPFVGQSGKRPEIWSYGHRNPQGAALNPATGELWETEHAAHGGDELNIPRAGRNYGWPVITWGNDYNGSKIGEGTSKPGMEQPLYYWNPSIGTSGLAFYTGDLFPQWKGNVLAGGLAKTVLQRLVMDGETVVAEEHLLVDRGERIRDVRVAPDGSVFVLTDEEDGKVLRLAPASPKQP